MSLAVLVNATRFNVHLLHLGKNMSKQMLIAGNWKMNVMNFDGIALANGLADKLKTAGELSFQMLVLVG